MRELIPLTVPDLGPEEEEAALAVMRSGMLVQGRRVAAFESSVAKAASREHGVAVSSGTAALTVSLQVLGVGLGDEVLVPAMSWPSPAHAVACLGATPVLVDVDPDEWNAPATGYADAISTRTKAAIVIDQFGNPARGAEIAKVLGEIPIVEDAACAIGSRFASGAPCGSLGALSTFSFHPRKVLTTGEGGVVVTDNEDFAQRLRALRNHGQAAPGTFVEAGINLRLTEIAGAIGEVQVRRLEELVQARQTRAQQIRAALESVLTFQAVPSGAVANYQTLAALLPSGKAPEEFIADARALGVQVGRMSYDLGAIGSLPPASMPNAAECVRRGIALPLYATMSDEEASHVIDVIQRVL
ncbi:MAG: DegT/DnrJ/EryC1/StrS family aminotransferase [Polyangiales bacterium]